MDSCFFLFFFLLHHGPLMVFGPWCCCTGCTADTYTTTQRRRGAVFTQAGVKKTVGLHQLVNRDSAIIKEYMKKKKKMKKNSIFADNGNLFSLNLFLFFSFFPVRVLMDCEIQYNEQMFGMDNCMDIHIL